MLPLGASPPPLGISPPPGYWEREGACPELGVVLMWFLPALKENLASCSNGGQEAKLYEVMLLMIFTSQPFSD